MRVSSRLMAENVIRNLNKQTTQLLNTQRKLATGKEINKISDNPVAMGRILDYRQSLAKVDQYTVNTTSGSNRVKFTENILDTVTELVNTAKKIAGDPHMEQADVMADEVRNVREQILQMANSKMNGNYIFSGFQTDTPPFANDGTYNGDTGDKKYMVGDNVEVSLRADGNYIFQGAADVFAVLDTLETALLAGDDAAVESQVQPLQNIVDHFKDVRAENASVHKRLEKTETYWKSFSNEVKQLLSNEEDVNTEAAAIDLLAQQNSYEIALATSAKIIQPNLMQFLS